MKKTITVIVPAFNEEANIKDAIENILFAIGNNFEDYEILVFDDGSTDRTGEIIDEFAVNNDKIKALHNGRNRGFGYCCGRGVEIAGMNYISILPGDNEIEGFSVREMFKAIGVADIISPYTVNIEVRPRHRIIISSLYVLIMNILFRCNLHYYTGPAIHRRDLLRKIPLKISNFAFMSVVLVKLIRSGYSFVEVPIYIRNRTQGKSKAFKIKHVISVLCTIGKLFWEVQISGKKKYSCTLVKRVIPNY
jgi:glycosyltransferase involved in cell wall biosynthesis